MSGGLVDKVYIGLDNAPAAFDIKGRILGPNGTNLEYIRSETGVVAVLKVDKLEPLHLTLHHTRAEALTAARSLAQNLIETIRAELAQWSAAQAGGPALNVPPPTLTTTSAPPPAAPPPSAAVSSPTMTTAQPMMPVVSVAPATAPLMTVRQPLQQTVLQLLPQQHQQQYVLNQENGQLIPIVQPGMPVQNTNFNLPIAQQLGMQQHNFGTQMIDLSSMQPVNVTQLRLPSSMSMILPNGLTIPQMSLASTDTTTVCSATSTPVVCAAPSTNSSQKILYSTDKGDKEVKYHIQGADGMQWTMPGSQTMLIPYQQLQDFAASQQGLNNMQQQYVSIAPAGGLQQTTLPFSAAQLQQLQATGTIMQLNQKPIASSGSLINIISTGQASSPQMISNSSTPSKNNGSQESRGQKRQSDGSPSQLQLRPIAPAGSISQDKGASRDARSWASAGAEYSTRYEVPRSRPTIFYTTSPSHRPEFRDKESNGADRDLGRDNTVVSMGMKINPAHGTIIHVSSGQQTNVSGTGMSQDGSGMYIRQIDRSLQLQNKDQKDLSKIQNQNVQMITVPQGMTVLHNPLNLSQVPAMQPNGQVYMLPTNQNLVQGGIPQGLIGQQMLPGQNVTVMQPNQLGVPGGVQYNVPLMQMNMPHNHQYMPGLNLNSQLSAQQLNAALAGQLQLTGNQHLGTIPIVQQSSQIPQTPQSVHQLLPQNFIPTSQYGTMPQQYIMPANGSGITANPNVQYTLPTPATPSNGNGNGNGNNSEGENSNGTAQTSYITSSSQDGQYTLPASATQTFPTDGATTQTPLMQPNPSVTPTYGSSSDTVPPTNIPYTNQTASQPPSYPSNGSTQTASYAATPASSQSTQQTFSPSTTPAPNQSYPAPNIPTMPMAYPPNQNPYPNATGQNLAAYASNQYQYNSRPWFRPRYGSPQGSPYSAGTGPAPNGGSSGGPMPVPPPTGNYNYWQDS